jgi:UDPglucose 6-dehydrogenase
MSAREPIGVIGTGYVGLTTAAGFAELGSEAWCVDIDAEKIERLRRGEVPIHEPGLDEVIAAQRERLHFSTDISSALERARLLFVAVGTPPTHSGDADLTAVHAVVEGMTRAGSSAPGDARAERARARAIVMKSTVPCGTGAAIKRSLERTGAEIAYVSCPEFLKEGSALADFMHPDRVVIGDDGGWAGEAVLDLYRPLLSPEHGGAGAGALVRTDTASAEMIKLASNAFLAAKISFINEIANVCEETGADVVEVARGMGLDARIGPRFLQAGIGYGGSCFTKDVSALKLLAGNSGYHFQLLAAVIEVNELQKRRVVSKLERHLGSLAGRRVALLGLAFKPDTDDMRGAASVVLAARLRAEGAQVSAFDPVAEKQARALMPDLDYAGSALEAVAGCDAAVLVTEWPQLIALDWREVAHAMAGTLVVDGRNALEPAAVEAAGLIYEGIGRGARGTAHARAPAQTAQRPRAPEKPGALQHNAAPQPHPDGAIGARNETAAASASGAEA